MQRVRSGPAKRVARYVFMYIKILAGECPGTPLVDGPDGPMSVCLTGGALPQRRVKGWVLAILAMLALRAVRGSGLLRSRLRRL